MGRGDFQGCRNVHELTVETVDGRSFTAEIEDAALSRRDAWPYMRYIDAGFRALARRTEPRGL